LEFGFYYRSFDKAIVHSLASAAAIKDMGVGSSTLVVPHGIYDIFNLSNLTQSSARDYFPQIKKSSTVVLFFGNLESRKGLWEILNTAYTLQNNDEFFFVIAGAPHLGSSGERAVERLEKAKSYSNCLIVDRRIDFQDVEKYFSAADIIALPYLEGTTSGVLKLALAFGKPVVATNVGDFPEQVPDGAGIFIEPDRLNSDLPKALMSIRENLTGFVAAMRTGGANAQWHDIATKTYNFLES
ncbi:MAG TPA: glycosyltransferase, partial [Cellvibrionaceae bacterium]|nr:glycosyltransferase [Cellvibrionaceae bacterium]